MQLLGIEVEDSSLQIISTDITPYNTMKYNTPFYLKYDKYYIGLDSNDTLRIFNDSIQDLLKQQGVYMTFLLEPKFNMYACENGECVQTEEGDNVYRNSDCYGIC